MENKSQGSKFYIKLLSVLLFIAYTSLLFVVRIGRAQIDDPVTKVENASVEKRKEYSGFAANMQAGLMIKSFPAFDVQKNNFLVDGALWFEFYVYQIGLDVIDKFTLEGGKILSKSAPNIKIEDDKLLVTYQIVLEVKGDFNHSSFPIANHRLVITMVNYDLPPSEMMFSDLDRAHSFIVAKNAFQSSDWGVHSLLTQPGIITTSLDEYSPEKIIEYPCLAFTINVVKKSFKDLCVLFLPIFTALLFSWLSLLMNVNNHTGRFTLAITAVTAILGYRYVIEQTSPRVGYFTMLDKFYLGFLLTSFLIFIFHLLMTSIWYRINKSLAAEVVSTGESQSDEVVVTGKTLSLMRDIFFFSIALTMYLMTGYILLY